MIILNNYCEEFESTLSLSLSLTLSLSLSLLNMSLLSAKAKSFEPDGVSGLGRPYKSPQKENYYSAVLAKVRMERDGLKEDKKIMKEINAVLSSEVTRLKNEVKELRNDRKEVKGAYIEATKAYTEAREDIADLKKELSEAESANKDLVEMNLVVRDECDYYRERNFTLNKEVSDLEYQLICASQPDHVKERFMEATLKMKFIFDEIKKIGALPEDHREWIDPLIEDIKIPEVSQELKERILPSDEYDPQDDDGDEFDQRERIQEWNDEEETEDKMPYGLRLLFAQDIAKANRYVSLMQSAVRKYLMNGSLRQKRDRSAILIQKIWRRYLVKPIKIFSSLGGPLGEEYWLKRKPAYPCSLTVRFINTGDITASVQKMTLNSVLVGQHINVSPLNKYRISFSSDHPESWDYYTQDGIRWSDTGLSSNSLYSSITAYQGDWYQIKYIMYTDSKEIEKVKYIQIPPTILTDIVEDDSYYYSSEPIIYTIDINTGFQLHKGVTRSKDMLDVLICQDASEMNSSKMIDVFRKRWDLPLM